MIDIEAGDYPAAHRAIHDLRVALDGMVCYPQGEEGDRPTALDLVGRHLETVEKFIELHEGAALAALGRRPPTRFDPS